MFHRYDLSCRPTRKIDLSVRIYGWGLIMAKRYLLLSRAKNADRRTALLGLTLAGRGSDKGSCLSDEDMAALVDGVCSGEERACYLQHLENCDDCYQHWVKLSAIVLSMEKNRGRDNSKTIIRPKHLAWAGSILAAAASVVLFLNITSKAPPPVLHRSMNTTFEQKNSAVLSPQEETRSDVSTPIQEKTGNISADKLDDDVTSGDALAPVTSMMKMREQVEKKYSHSKSTTVQKGKRTGKRKTVALPHRSRSGGIQQGQSRVRLWLDKVQQGCQGHETNTQFWTRQYMLGKQMSRFQSVEEKKLVQELLPLVGKLREPTVKSSVCERIVQYFNTYSAE